MGKLQLEVSWNVVKRGIKQCPICASYFDCGLYSASTGQSIGLSDVGTVKKTRNCHQWDPY